MITLKNFTERSFSDYMMSKKPYRKSTVGHYIVRMRRIKPLDELVHDNLDAHIADYETGANSAINHSSHNVYSCALRHFKDYKEHVGII